MGLILRVAHLMILIVVCVFVLTQVVIPLWMNRSTFPIFRRKKSLDHIAREMNDYLHEKGREP